MADSFTTKAKNEIAHSAGRSPCCAASEITGFIRACGSVTLAGKGGMGLKMATESAAVARRYKTLMETAYGAGAKLMVGEGAAVRRARVYELSVPPGPAADSILVASGIIRLAGGKREMREGHPDFAFGRKCCRKACMKGLFLGVGVVSDPEKGYNFEMAFTSEATASAARRLLNSFTGLRARVRRRRSSYVVYLKNSEQIRDALAIMGAHAQLLKFEEVRMVRGMKGHVNRLGNCDAANMDRALGAAERQLAQIRSIEARDGLDSLPDELIDTALTRIFHPDASLAEIGRLLIPPVGKAAVGARFKRIAEYAEESWPPGATPPIQDRRVKGRLE